jgi:hypothetical protein
MSGSTYSTLPHRKQLELAEKTLALHQWSPHAHGHYWGTSQQQHGECIKNDITKTCKVVREPITVELLVRHLRGEYALGGFPLWNDSTAAHAALDVDNYAIDCIDIGRRVQVSKLPLIPVGTKSGGLRLILPCKVREPADFLRKVAAKCRLFLGLNDGSTKEIFPKQDRWPAGDPDFCGSWYALPYLGESWPGKSQPQVARNATGGALLLAEYLSLYEHLQASHEQLEAILARNTRQPGVTGGEVWRDDLPVEEFLAGAPPCIHAMLTSQVGEGERNTCLTHCASFARKKYPDNIVGTLRRLDQMLMASPLDDEEVSKLAERTRKGEIGNGYMCNHVVGYCDKAACKHVKFGAFSNGSGSGALDEPFVVSIDEMAGEDRMAFVTINGEVFRMTAESLMVYGHIVKTAMGQLGMNIGKFGDKKGFMKEIYAAWEVRGKLPPPPGFEQYATYLGYLNEYVRFRSCVTGSPPKGKETISGWIDVSEDPPKCVFKMLDLEEFIQRHHHVPIDKLRMMEAIRSRGGNNYSGSEDYGERRRRNCWYVPMTDDEQEAKRSLIDACYEFNKEHAIQDGKTQVH